MIVCEPYVGDGDVVELDAAETLELDDDVAVVVDAHEGALGSLELAGDNQDVAALLAFQEFGVDVGEGVLVVGDHVHEASHVSLGHGDGSAPCAVVQLVAAVLHIVQLVGMLRLQVVELAVVCLDDDEIEYGGHQLAVGSAFLIVCDCPLHRQEVLDALSVEEILHAEDFLGAGIIDPQGVPLERREPLTVCTRGSCRLGRDHNRGDCMYIISLHLQPEHRAFDG